MDRTEHHPAEDRRSDAGDSPTWLDLYNACDLLRARIQAVLQGAAHSYEASADGPIIIDLIWLADDLCEELNGELDELYQAYRALKGCPPSTHERPAAEAND